MNYINEQTIVEVVGKRPLLIVEDEEELREYLAKVLSRYFPHIIVAHNGLDGLEKYQRCHPFCVISDIHMPFCNGLEMAKKIRENVPDMPIIFTTAFTDTRYLLDAIELGIKHYIRKPISNDILLQSLNDILSAIHHKQLLAEGQLHFYQQAKISAMEGIITNIAHQWRQPLASISAVLMSMKSSYVRGTLTEEKFTRNVNQCQSVLETMSETIEDFRRFYDPAREMKMFSLFQTWEKVMPIIKPRIQETNAKVETDIEKQYMLYGYQNEFAHVLLNLAMNALENFSRHQHESPWLSISAENRETQLIIRVKDNGGGFLQDPENFFLEGVSTKETGEGGGLGLYLARLIIQTHFNGTISAKNSAEGAEFEIILPHKEGIT